MQSAGCLDKNVVKNLQFTPKCSPDIRSGGVKFFTSVLFTSGYPPPSPGPHNRLREKFWDLEYDHLKVNPQSSNPKLK